jgi:predicted nucleic acid-binding protein
MLIDSNILLRILQKKHPQHETAATAIEFLVSKGQQISIAPQNLVEVWVVATRPQSGKWFGHDNSGSICHPCTVEESLQCSQ